MYESVSTVDDIRYNPATSSFEGLVTFETQDGRTRVAAEYPAPLDMEYDAAIEELRAEAMSSLERPNALRSVTKARLSDNVPTERGGFFPIRELFGNLFGNRAA
ncbi:hypothetical protein OCH239_19065 [Roseivivax halodurans JCM 10272]|uniref:Orotidine 5-phosphate decarboxylase n=1 Tax=Roseivivax halodurans JCM 10272 TaxID=1449350 RepID=X7EIF7_9RHOB|nr:hypothetical protein [Roseivivax halodurans]ETX14903.1 hypothetical protein OCH239_19065 [Roseivivax halodurans JCM 10272]